MFKQFFAVTVLFKFGLCQLNGEFWWLNEKLVKHNGVQPSLPVYEDLSEFDSDESVKIIFSDDNFVNDIKLNNPLENSAREVRKETQKDKLYPNLIKWPDDGHTQHVKKTKLDNYPYQGSVEEVTSAKPSGRPEWEDKLIFTFPKEDNFVWKDILKEPTAIKNLPNTVNLTNDKNNSTAKTLHNDQISLNILHKVEQSQNICTNLVKSECLQRNGTVYSKAEESKNIMANDICCVLPLQSQEDVSSKIYFPDMLKKSKRPKRSDDGNDGNFDFEGQNQRKNLLVHKYAHRRQKQKPQIQTRVTTPDYEYDDPYWNIKIKTPNQKKQESNTRYDYQEEDIEEYTVEIPRPGLTGIYSDYGQRPIWGVFDNGKEPPYSDNDDYDEDDSGSFGYSTIDPRLVTSKTKRFRPQKLTTDSDKVGYEAESQTITYSSNPNFNVLKDFKLPNLMRNKSKSSSKISRTTTTESFADDDNEGVLLGSFLQSDENHNDDQNQQIFDGCGKAVRTEILRNNGKQIGEAVNGSHPWLALVVPTRKPNTVLCYATLIHPRAAITSANCVQSKQGTGDLTLIIGLWNLNERSRARSRVPSVRLHPQFEEGLNHNMALLYWKNPLTVGFNVQPACLGTPNLEDDLCIFVGWGGFDQAIRPRSRWQRAAVHTCKDHLSLNGVDIPSEAFCATVQARNTVTGIGGSLICTKHGRMTAVGVAVSRDSTLVMLPVYEWAMRSVNNILQDN